MWTRKSSFHIFWKFFFQKSEKFSLKNRKNSEKETKNHYFFRNFYSGHVDRILRTIPKVSAENPKRFKTFKKYFNQQIVPLVTQKVVLTTFWRFFAESLKKFSLKIRKKIWKEKSENCFLRKFYSGHLYRNLRTIPLVSAENPKRFKTFKKYFKPQIVPLVTQKVVLTTFWRFFAESLKKFSLKIRKNSERKNEKTLFLPQTLLWTRR